MPTNPPTDHQAAVKALLADRQHLKRVLPRVLAKAQETYPPSLLAMLDWHRTRVEDATLYAQGVGQAAIAARQPGRSKQSVDGGVKKLVEKYLLAYPELMEDL